MSELGSIYTPQEYARFLTAWAIRDPSDQILDLGTGEGAFVFAAYDQLIELGADKTQVSRQIHGAEIDSSAYEKFANLAKEKNVDFPNVHQADFFSIKFPQINAVIGNPPYIRRKYISDVVDNIRARVLEKNSSIAEDELLRLTDLYIYFLLHALPSLKPDGRLATIIADSWLNVRYGRAFKKYLIQNFNIEQIISLDRAVFSDAQVKPVLLLCTRKQKVSSNWQIPFVRVKNGLPISVLRRVRETARIQPGDIIISQVPVKELKIENPWGIYLKAPDVHELLANHKLMTPIANLASTRIGIQTLAKDFFALTPERIQYTKIESEFLQPFAHSSKYFDTPVILNDSPILLHLFYCSKSKYDLKGTMALKYIEDGEKIELKVREKNNTIIGYHNKERIQKANRLFWYDLQTDVERRGRAEILIPRLIYRTFTVIWNKANFVPGGAFIEFIPHDGDIDVRVYLAILNSSLSEIMLRTEAQVYGGGTYNIGLRQIKETPILDVKQLDKKQKTALTEAYKRYLVDENHSRSQIDAVICKILSFDTNMQDRLNEVLADLRLIATSAKKSA